MKGIKHTVVGGLRIKTDQFEEYTSLLVQDEKGKVVFRGAIIFKFWAKIKAAFDSIGVAD